MRKVSDTLLKWPNFHRFYVKDQLDLRVTVKEVAFCQLHMIWQQTGLK